MARAEVVIKLRTDGEDKVRRRMSWSELNKAVARLHLWFR